MTDDRQQLQLLVALAARHGRVDEQEVRLLRVEQRLAFELEGPDLGMHEVLHRRRAQADLLQLPESAELGALPQQPLDELRGARARSASRTISVRMCGVTRHPTIMRENASTMKHTYATPA